ncbi:MAG: beta-lactamase family protein [Lachnospiraceae bacterium]|nr:beta-lactamase family protein [Lachnospiraceae bacterium]
MNKRFLHNKRIMVFLIILIITFTSTVILPTYSKEEEDTKKASFGTASSDDVEEIIRGFIEEKEKITPAVAVCAFSSDGDICNVVYGKNDIEGDVYADEDTVFEWGSISKVLIWVSAMQLYEQGKLDLEADIRNYLPKGFLDNLKYDEPITMLNLMNHDAGFMSPYKDMECENIDELMTLEEALKEIAPAQAYRPGEIVAYSNYGAALAGYVIECVSGMDYADYVRINIFDKLGMKHTSIRPDCSDNEWVAKKRKETHCYIISENGELKSLGECRRYIHLYPAGSACGTISDLAIFAEAFLCDGEDCPLFENKTTLDEMLSPSKYYADGKTPRFCHGLFAEQYGSLLLGHGGNTEGFSSLMKFDRENKTGFVMMINLRGDVNYKGELPELLYGKADYSDAVAGDFKKYNLAGNYTMSGGMFATGCFKICSFFDDNLKVVSKGEKYTGTNGIEEMVQISEREVLVRLVTGREYIYYIKTDADGDFKGLENKSVDFIKVSLLRRIMGWGTIILIFLGLAIMILLLIFNLIRFGKYRKSSEAAFKKTELLMGITSAAILISLLLLAHFEISSRVVVITTCVLNALLSLILIVLNILCRVKKDGKAGVVLWIEHFCSLFIITGIVYWRLFQFWGF